MSSEPPPPEATQASASPPKEASGGGGAAPGTPETNTLWVGNLHPHANEDDVMAAFAPHGALDCVLSRAGSRGYGFVLFRSVAEARAALEALQGAKVKGSVIRNEFARPARAVRNLWVGGISPSIAKEELEEEFEKFGKVEGLAFSHDQTSAYIDFEKLEDAISAHRALNGTVLGGKELCVDFQRSRGRVEWSEAGNFSARLSMPPGDMRIGQAKGSAGIRLREAQPTNVLWVGFPNSFKINEEVLRRAMAAHGVVTNIKVFPSRQYAFVEFASTDEASKAKNHLDGRLFNDHRIQILFSNSELAPNKLDNPTPLAGFPKSQMNHKDGPYGPHEYFGSGRGNQGTLQGYDPRRGRSRYFDYGGVPVTGGILPSPDPGPPSLTGRSAWNAFDPKDAKRVRLDAGADPYDTRAGSEGLYPVGFSHQDGVVHADGSSSPVIRIQGTVHRTSFLGHFWRGSIAKGGSPVCRARCLAIRKGIEIPLPDVVNCSARTGLDMLAKHYGDASGFDIVFFLPDSEDDFVSYTEFLRYLGSKGRAGVVKVDAGTTLFLVPPSDFLKNVLQVDGPERLYGVVLHIPQMSSTAVQRPLLTGPEPQSYYDERETVFSSQRDHGMVNPNENYHRDADYRGSLREDSLHSLGQIPARPRVDERQAVQPALASFLTNQTAVPLAVSSLKPDVMATLAKLMPSMQSSAQVTDQVPLSSTDRPSASIMHDAFALSKVWKPENQAIGSSSFEQMGRLQQSGQQYSKQAPAAHLTNYGSTMGAQEHSTQHTAYNPEITLNLPPPPPPPTLAPSSALLSSIGGHSLPTQLSQQQYQSEQYYVSQSNYSPLATASHSNLQASNTNLPAPPPPQVNHGHPPANNQMGNLAQLHQQITALPADRVSSDFSSQVQQQQNVASGAAQAPDDADKNKKYQATLQFAHNLLLQLQRGSGNQP